MDELLSKMKQGYLTEYDIIKLNSRKINFASSNCMGKLLKLCNYLEKLLLEMFFVLFIR